MPYRIIFQGVFSVIILVVLYYFYKKWPTTEQGKHSKKYIFNFKMRPENLFDILLPLIITIFVSNFFISRLTNKAISPALLPNPLLFLIVGVIVQPLLEEVMFRGIVLGVILVYAENFKALDKAIFTLIGIIFTGYLFAEWHFISEILSGEISVLSGDILLRPGGILKIIYGILFGLFFWLRKRNLFSSYSAHVTNNFIAFLYAYSIL